MRIRRIPDGRCPAVALLIVLLAFVPKTSAQQSSTMREAVRDVYETHNRAAVAARGAGDWAAVKRHAAAVDTLFNGNPSTLMALARASARLGDTSAALSTLRTVVAMGVVRNLAADQDLATLTGLPEWSALVAANESNARPVGAPRTVFTLPDIDFLAEDVVWDARNDRYLVSSVRKRSIVSVTRQGAVKPFVDGANYGLWGIFGLAVDSARSRLWATTIAMPQVEGFAAADSGRSAVIRIDLATGAVRKRYELPATARGNSPGDIAIADNGDLYVSDSRSGIVYALRTADDSLAVLVPEGTFMSPQGPAVSADGNSLYIADYVRGLAQVDLSSREVKWMKHSRDVALSGIDGLTAVSATQLIGIQNGVMPNRLIALTIDPSGNRVVSAKVLAQDTASIREPTHGLLAGGEFQFIANSGWDGFDDSGKLRKDHGLRPPAIVSVRISF